VASLFPTSGKRIAADHPTRGCGYAFRRVECLWEMNKVPSEVRMDLIAPPAPTGSTYSPALRESRLPRAAFSVQRKFERKRAFSRASQ
jgi:hypothetical protein